MKYDQRLKKSNMDVPKFICLIAVIVNTLLLNASSAADSPFEALLASYIGRPIEDISEYIQRPNLSFKLEEDLYLEVRELINDPTLSLVDIYVYSTNEAYTFSDPFSVSGERMPLKEGRITVDCDVLIGGKRLYGFPNDLSNDRHGYQIQFVDTRSVANLINQDTLEITISVQWTMLKDGEPSVHSKQLSLSSSVLPLLDYAEMNCTFDIEDLGLIEVYQACVLTPIQLSRYGHSQVIQSYSEVSSLLSASLLDPDSRTVLSAKYCEDRLPQRLIIYLLKLDEPSGKKVIIGRKLLEKNDHTYVVKTDLSVR